jgi:hypothetical protein
VNDKILSLLLDNSKFVDLTDLLDENRTPGGAKPSGGTQVVHDSITGQLVVKQASRATVQSFAAWTEAYSVLLAYRIFAYPEVALPMVSYMSLMSDLAHPDHGYPLHEWTEYDRRFRHFMSAHSTTPDLWAHIDVDIKHRTCTSHLSAKPNQPVCRFCQEPGHFWKNCPLTNRNPQSFRNDPATDGEICKKFNRGDCRDSICPNGYVHKCNLCGLTSHTRVAFHGDFSGKFGKPQGSQRPRGNDAGPSGTGTSR